VAPTLRSKTATEPPSTAAVSTETPSTSDLTSLPSSSSVDPTRIPETSDESQPSAFAHREPTPETTNGNGSTVDTSTNSPARAIVTKPKIVDSDSDSDSDSPFTPLYTAYTNQKGTYNQPKMSSNVATVEHPITKHCPILTAGEITPKALVDLVNAHNEYFIAKDIDEADKVKKVLGGFKCVHVRDWISCDRARLLMLSYNDFMTEVRANYLPSDWEEMVRTQILGMQMKKGAKFWDWCQEMRAINIILRGTDSHLSDFALRNQLEANLEPSLRSYVFREKINKTTVLKDWILAVKDADEKLKDDRKRNREIFAEEAASRNAKRPALTDNSRGGNAAKPVSGSSDPTCKKCSKLTDDERRLLERFNGCFKCRRYNQSHGAANCPHGFPDGNTYQTLTPTRDAAGNAPKSAASSGSKAKGKSVAYVAPAEQSSSDEEDVIAAVMPTAVLGNGSFSEDDVSPPLRAKHFVVKFKIYGPRLDFALTFSTLVDNGAHIVLIRPDVVDELGLTRHLLEEPELVDVAIDDGQKKTKKALTEYVKLSVTSVDNAWTSRTVHALIAPGLCMPVILGLPFLIHNHIVTDHAARSCIDKKTGYNLLHPATIKPPRPPPLKAKEQIKRTKTAKKLVLEELAAVCQTRKEKGKLVFENVQDVDVVGAIRDAIENIALKERLKDLEVEVKQEFRVLFEEIPHYDDLPVDYVARIKLKNAYQQISNRSYPCPRKYREAFKTLISQHLEAGRIRHSSSSYASPCFIIPKADPKVLPRWVNDFRELNANTVVDSHPLPRCDDILNDCAKGKVWSSVDMTNSFFQTRMHPDDIHLTAVNTPFGLFEWLVMPMGLRNSPAIHQRRVTTALQTHIGRICHVYLDDIIIWSDSVEQHIADVRAVLTALRTARLYINEKKTKLFQTQINFLGHTISAKGIEADSKKVDTILDWPTPKSATQDTPPSNFGWAGARECCLPWSREDAWTPDQRTNVRGT